MVQELKDEYQEIIKKIELNDNANSEIAGNYGRTLTLSMQEGNIFKWLIEKALWDNDQQEGENKAIYDDAIDIGRTALIDLTDESTIQGVKNLLMHRRDIARMLITDNPSLMYNTTLNVDNLYEAYRHANKQIKLRLRLNE